MFRHNASGVTWSCLIFSLHRVLVSAFHRACLAHIEAMEGVQDDMEVDDGCTLYSRDLGDAVSDGTESNESADDSTYVTCLKEGPRDFAELQAWPALLVDQMKSAEEDGGEENIAFATSMLGCGFALESDFAGAGGGEMGITSVINEFADQYGVERRANIYRSGDIGELQRKTLMHPGWEGPSHVTGDITHCVLLDGRHELNKLHTRAEAAFEEERNTCSGKDAAQRVGCSFMSAVLSCLATVTFLDAQWCFRHKRRCTLHAPASMGTRCMIAGTVCKPFSSMSKSKKNFCCHTTIAAMVWAYNVLLSLPEFALHECVLMFDVQWHKQILDQFYCMASVVWCISQQGDPVRRRRRYTLWTRWDRIRLGVLYNLEELMRRYFRKLVLDGLVYFLAGVESHKMDELRTALMHFADEQYVMVDEATTFRHVLPQCYLQRLWVYEKMANRNMIPVRKLIVNLAQNCRWAKIRKSDCVVPTLLTANSMSYSMGMGRMMLASDKLLAQNVPYRGSYGIRHALLDGTISKSDCEFMAGNMMNCKAMATAFMWVLFASRPPTDVLPHMLWKPAEEDEEEHDWGMTPVVIGSVARPNTLQVDAWLGARGRRDGGC